MPDRTGLAITKPPLGEGNRMKNLKRLLLRLIGRQEKKKPDSSIYPMF